MSSGWIFYRQKGDEVAVRFHDDGAVELKTEGLDMLMSPTQICMRRGKILSGRTWKKGCRRPWGFSCPPSIKHPILFNRWFLQKLGEQKLWKEYVKKWKQEAVETKQEQLWLRKVKSNE